MHADSGEVSQMSNLMLDEADEDYQDEMGGACLSDSHVCKLSDLIELLEKESQLEL